MIYFDNSATTKPYKEVVETFLTVSTKYYGNPSSMHSIGGQAERILMQARKNCASLLHVKENEILFTSGGTEGNNMAIKGIAFKHQNRGKHIITSAVEHASTYEVCKELEKQGFDISFIPVDRDGRISPFDIQKEMREDTILVTLIHVNNELGTIQPIEEIAGIVNQYPKAFFHVDHVQGQCKVPLDLSSKVDLCTISGHKFHGLKGTGILFVRDGITLAPLIQGGPQERDMRAGTENIAGIASLAKALRLSMERADEGIKRLEKMKSRMTEGLEKIDGVFINTPEKQAAPHIINFSVPGLKPEVLLHSLEEEDIYVSTKSACSSKDAESRILMELGLGKERASTSIRVSFSFENTEIEVDRFLSSLTTNITKLKKIMG